MSPTRISRARLAMIPTRLVPHEDDEDGRTVLLREERVGGPFGRLLQSLVPARTSRTRLDEVGTAVWRLVDGDRSVEEIADILGEEMGERVEPRHERVLLFVEALARGKAVTLKRAREEGVSRGTP